MFNKFSLWAVYTASYLFAYMFLLVVSFYKKVLEYRALTLPNAPNFLQYCSGVDYLIWVVLVIATVFSILCLRWISKIKMNSRIRYQPQENITLEVMGYILPQVLTIVTIGFADFWELISLMIFLITGIIFVRSKKVYLSPLFIIPLRYTVYQSGNKVIITKYSQERMRRALECNQEGVEARELEPNIYLVH